VSNFRVPDPVSRRTPLAQRIAAAGEPELHVPPIRIVSAQIDSGRAVAPTVSGLFSPFVAQNLSAGESVRVQLVFAVAACARRGSVVDLRLRALDVRLRVAGGQRVQRVRLQRDLRVRCDTTRG
jgi:hypothetical protein